jgi:2,3-bisphosphoglycerate-independent phosphoglycerate mutase
VNTYDEAPEMSAAEVADEVVQAMDSGRHAFIVVNFANGDMVGHTGVPEAIVRAVEAVDMAVGRVLDKALEAGYAAVVTADHGNCEQMVDPATGEALTQHTANPVPCMIVDSQVVELAAGQGLDAVAPTILDLMGLECPAAMATGSLIRRRKLVRAA